MIILYLYNLKNNYNSYLHTRKKTSDLHQTFVSIVPLLPNQSESTNGGKDVYPSTSYSGDGREVEDSEWDE